MKHVSFTGLDQAVPENEITVIVDPIEEVKHVRFSKSLRETVAFVRVRSGNIEKIPLDSMRGESGHLFVDYLKSLHQEE